MRVRKPGRGYAVSALLGGGLFISAFGAGCGHPASQEECEAILTKTAELELAAQNITEPTQVAEGIQRFREARGEKVITECVGIRITDEAISCVKGAADTAQVDECLN